MILELLKKRRSVRDFNEKNVPDHVIDYILECGRLSPSGGNEQSWKFGLIKDRDIINEITEYSYNQKWISKASFLIVLCSVIVDKEEGGRDVQKKRYPNYLENIENLDDALYNRLHQEEHQTKIAGTHMVLAALEHGVGSTWVSYFNADSVTCLLQLPKNVYASEILAFGYPASERKHRPKKDLETILFLNKYEEGK